MGDTGPSNENVSIDAVITWVDSANPDVATQLAAASRQVGVSVDPSRYTSNGELAWCVRYIRAYLPWIGNIFVVTNGQSPGVDGVQVVHHSDIFPDTVAVPCFNSEVIEWHCHNIDGLSDRHILFNDDMFPGRALRPADVCGEFGVGLTWFDNSPINLELATPMTARQQAVNFLHTFLRTEFGQGSFLAPAHVPRYYYKPHVKHLYARYAQWIALLSKHQLRSIFSFPLYVVHAYRSLSDIYGHCDLESLFRNHKEIVRIPPWKDYVFIPYGDETSRKWIDQIFLDRPKFFCFNDHIRSERHGQASELGKILKAYLQPLN